MSELNAKVVLAALDDILAPMTTHKATHLTIMRGRVRKLRDHVAQYVDPQVGGCCPADEERCSRAKANGYAGCCSSCVHESHDDRTPGGSES